MERPYRNHHRMLDDEDEATLDRKEGMKFKGDDYDLKLNDSDEKHTVPLTTAKFGGNKEPSKPVPSESKRSNDQVHEVALTAGRARRNSKQSNPISPFRSFRKSFRKSWSRKRQQSKTNKYGFAVELQQAHQRWQQKQLLLADSEEKKDDSSGFHQREMESEYYPPKAIGIFNSGLDDDDDEIRAQLQNEIVKNLALKDKLDETEQQLRTIKETQSNEFVDHYTAQIRQLQQEISNYESLLEDECRKRNMVEKKLAEQEERMRVIMFQEIPEHSPQFKDIGTVNHSIVESYSSVGAYKLEEILGRGQYGSVRLAVRQDTKEPFAIKIINKEKIKRQDYPPLAVECRVLLRFPHPNIIRFEEVIHASENIYIVTERGARDLFSYYKEFRLNEKTTKQLALGLLLSLVHLHQNGICHLDLKPENVLITTMTKDFSYENIRLADFGLARMAPRSAETRDVVLKGVVCGTAPFFAPEMMTRRNGFIGQKADMWSFGSLLLEDTVQWQPSWLDAYHQAENDPEYFEDGLRWCLDILCAEHYPIHADMIDFVKGFLKINPSERATASLALRHPWLEDVVQPEMLQN